MQSAEATASSKTGVAHAEIFNDLVSRDANFGKLKELNSRENNTLTVMNIVDTTPGNPHRIRIPYLTSHAVWKTFAHGWLRLSGAPKCLNVDPHRAQITREFFDQAEERGIFVDAVPAEAHWHMEQVENHARYLRMMGTQRWKP